MTNLSGSNAPRSSSAYSNQQNIHETPNFRSFLSAMESHRNTENSSDTFQGTMNNDLLASRVQSSGIDSLYVRVGNDGNASVQMRAHPNSGTTIRQANPLESAILTLPGAAGSVNFISPARLIASLNVLHPHVASQIREQVSDLLNIQQRFNSDDDQQTTYLLHNRQAPSPEALRELNVLSSLESSVDNQNSNPSEDLRDQSHMIPEFDRIEVVSNFYEPGQNIASFLNEIHNNIEDFEGGVVEYTTVSNINPSALFEDLNESDTNHFTNDRAAVLLQNIRNILSGRSRSNTERIVFPVFNEITNRRAISSPSEMEPFKDTDCVCPITLNQALTLDHPVQLKGKIYELSDLARAVTDRFSSEGLIEDPMRNAYATFQDLLDELTALDFDQELKNRALEELF